MTATRRKTQSRHREGAVEIDVDVAFFAICGFVFRRRFLLILF